jgi:hypothetical protein
VRDAVEEPWNWRREKTVLEKGMRKPRTPRRVGFPGYRLVMRCVKGNGGSYLVFWQDLLLLLRVGRRDARIGRR